MRYIFLLSILLVSRFGISQYSDYNTNEGKVIDSYDVVSYFEGNPQKGKETYTILYDAVDWYFMNNENLQKFRSDPEKYVPQYGGWCAYAMAIDGSKVKIDPETYKIVDGKLYLFYNFNLTNTLKSWNKNESEFLKKADSFWLKQ